MSRSSGGRVYRGEWSINEFVVHPRTTGMSRIRGQPLRVMEVNVGGIGLEYLIRSDRRTRTDQRAISPVVRRLLPAAMLLCWRRFLADH